MEEMQHDMLISGANHNFPEMHLISHFAEQIRKYGSLPQYSTEMYEASHKPLKDTYRRSNHIDTIPQMIQTYTRANTLAMRDNNPNQWITEQEHIHNNVQTIIHPTHLRLHLAKGYPSHPLATRLQCPINATSIYILNTLQVPYCLDNRSTLTTTLRKRNTFRDTADPESDTYRLVNAPLEAFQILQLEVATFNDDGHELHHVLCTGPELWRKQEQSND